MAISPVTVTFSLYDFLGFVPDTRRTKVVLTTNVGSGFIADTSTGGGFRITDTRVTISSTGVASFSVLPSGATGLNPAAYQIRVQIDAANPATRQRAMVDLGYYTITAACDLKDLVAAQYVPPTYVSSVLSTMDTKVASAAASETAAAASAALARSIAGISTPDGVVSTLMADTASATYGKTVAKYPTTTSGQTISQLLAQSSDAGAFYQGYDHSQIFESGVHDPIHSMGYNFSATRGRADNAYGALGWAIEGRYKYLGEIIQEWYIQHVPRSGKTVPGGGAGYRRPIAFSIMEDGDEAVTPYIQGHICATGFQFLQEDMATEIVYITSAGFTFSGNHNVRMNSTAAGNAQVRFSVDDTVATYQTIFRGDPAFYLWDAQNARSHIKHTFGSTISASATEFNGKVIAMGSVTPGNSTTGARPAASSHTRGMWYDNTLGIPIFSDGTNWRNAAGSIV